MKILTVSDTVSQKLLEAPVGEAEFQGIELLLSCGDLPPEYLSSLRHRFNVPLLYVLGNHDLRYGSSPPAGCISIDKQVMEHGGLKILGLSGSRWYNGGMNQFTEKEMRQAIRGMRFTLWRKKGPDIVVTHAPPRHIKDAEDPCHKGFKSYVRLIEKYQPSYFIHGHIHKLFENESERITQFNNTKVINSYGFYILEI